MIGLKLSFEPYRLLLKQPFRFANSRITERKGFIISLTDGKFTGFGDSVPFPEIGSETYNAAEGILQNLKAPIKVELENLNESILKNSENLKAFPTVRHGIEQAILSYLSIRYNKELHVILNQKKKKEIKINAVISKDIKHDEILDSIREKMFEGFDTFKIKLGSPDFESDLKLAHNIEKNIKDSVLIRYDLNGQWKLTDALYRIKQFEGLNIDYVEQPVMNKEDLAELSLKTTVRIGADESVRNIENAKFLCGHSKVNTFILKPMLTGGIVPIFKIREITEGKIRLVVSSSFESSLGWSYAVDCASMLDNDDAHGLDTQNIFQNNIALSKYKIEPGKITL